MLSPDSSPRCGSSLVKQALCEYIERNVKIAKYNFLILFLLSTKVIAVEYYCETTEKHDFGITYGQETIYQAKFATKVEETKNGTYLSRCSMSFKKEEPEITCDRYAVDKIEYDENVKIKKYYV